jgi:hypothetical protein
MDTMRLCGMSVMVELVGHADMHGILYLSLSDVLSSALTFASNITHMYGCLWAITITLIVSSI